MLIEVQSQGNYKYKTGGIILENKKYLELPKEGKDTVLFSISLAHSVNGKPVTKEIVVDAFERADIEITEDLKREIEETYPNIVL